MLRSNKQLEGWAIMSLLRSRKTLWQPLWAEGVFSSPFPRVAINRWATRAYLTYRATRYACLHTYLRNVIITVSYIIRWLSSNEKWCRPSSDFSGRGLGTRLGVCTVAKIASCKRSARRCGCTDSAGVHELLIQSLAHAQLGNTSQNSSGGPDGPLATAMYNMQDKAGH